MISFNHNEKINEYQLNDFGEQNRFLQIKLDDGSVNYQLGSIDKIEKADCEMLDYCGKEFFIIFDEVNDDEALYIFLKYNQSNILHAFLLSYRFDYRVCEYFLVTNESLVIFGGLKSFTKNNFFENYGCIIVSFDLYTHEDSIEYILDNSNIDIDRDIWIKLCMEDAKKLLSDIEKSRERMFRKAYKLLKKDFIDYFKKYNMSLDNMDE